MKPDREKIYIYGRHALVEALTHAPRAVKKVFLSGEANRDEALRKLLNERKVPFVSAQGNEAARMVGEDTAHQGVIAIVDPSAVMVDFDDFSRGLAGAKRGGRGAAVAVDAGTMLVLLDELTDPHNVGAIIRSAAAFGAAGVLLPFYRQAPITGAVVKASAGMVFRMPIVSIGNVNQTVDALKEMGFQTYGLMMDGTKNVFEAAFDTPTLFIVGNEGKGIRQKTLERCDVSLRIPMDPRCESLNASVSAAVVLYEWSKRHLNK